jgi:predicted acetyltransferase
VRAAYAAQASRTAGSLDRNNWAWQRIFSPILAAQNTYGYLVEQDGRVTGYLFYAQVQGERIAHAHKLVLSDFVALTPEAGRRLLTFLADHVSMVDSITWYGAPADPIHYLLEEQLWRHVDRLDWMLRVVDVAKALEARGYPPGATGKVHFDVKDDVLAQNSKRFVLEVAESCGHVRKGGQGTIRIDVRGLAAIYTGHITPLELKMTGLVDAADDDLMAMARFFAGPSPWMSDRF